MKKECHCFSRLQRQGEIRAGAAEILFQWRRVRCRLYRRRWRPARCVVWAQPDLTGTPPRERMDKNSLTERAKLLAATIADWNN